MICENNMEHTTSVNLQFRVPTFMMTHITFSHIRLDHEVQTSSTWAMDTSMMRMQQIVDQLSNIISKASILAMSRDTFDFSIKAKTLLQTVDKIICMASILAMSRDTFVAFQLNLIKNIHNQQIVDHLSSIISKAPILAMSRDTFAFSIQAKTLLQTVDNIISKTSILAMSRNAFDAFQFNAIKYNAYQVFVCQYQYKCLQYINVQYTVGLY